MIFQLIQQKDLLDNLLDGGSLLEVYISLRVVLKEQIIIGASKVKFLNHSMMEQQE